MRHPLNLVLAALLLMLAACGPNDETPGSSGTDVGPTSPARSIEEQWEFYPARIDDLHASVLVNLGYRVVAPLAGSPHLLWVNIKMPDAGKDGLGSPETAEHLRRVEDALTERLREKLSARVVARIRGKGKWQVRYYAPAADGFEEAAREVLKAHDDLEVDLGSDGDPEWRYYFDFLVPGAERAQWIKDRRVVEQLEKNGDVLTTPRPVDHWLYFESAEARSRFESSIAELGFRVRSRDELTEGKPARPFSLNVDRVDKVDLESIHRVVVRLMEAAKAAGGVYDGWGCSVVRAADDE